jgi:hypothetical protein
MSTRVRYDLLPMSRVAHLRVIQASSLFSGRNSEPAKTHSGTNEIVVPTFEHREK